MSEKEIKICEKCGSKPLRLEDFGEAESVIYRRYEEWKQLGGK